MSTLSEHVFKVAKQNALDKGESFDDRRVPNQWLLNERAISATLNEELILLRNLRKAVEADRVGCVSVQPMYNKNGRWFKDQWVTTQDALKALEGFK